MLSKNVIVNTKAQSIGFYCLDFISYLYRNNLRNFRETSFNSSGATYSKLTLAGWSVLSEGAGKDAYPTRKSIKLLLHEAEQVTALHQFFATHHRSTSHQMQQHYLLLVQDDWRQ